jgi:trk system potassium uptake protein TrkA
VIVPQPEDPLEAGDELLFVATSDVEPEIRTALGY